MDIPISWFSCRRCDIQRQGLKLRQIHICMARLTAAQLGSTLLHPDQNTYNISLFNVSYGEDTENNN
jgi:hypothetical protein